MGKCILESRDTDLKNSPDLHATCSNTVTTSTSFPRALISSLVLFNFSAQVSPQNTMHLSIILWNLIVGEEKPVTGAWIGNESVRNLTDVKRRDWSEVNGAQSLSQMSLKHHVE